VIGSVVECFGFVTTIIVVAWVCDWRTFFDDGGVDTEESRRGRSAAKKRVMKRECGGEEGRRRNRVHCSPFVFTFFGSTFKAVKEDECVVWGYLLNFQNQKSFNCFFVKLRFLFFDVKLLKSFGS
jgi:hypothetical protein